MRKLSKIKKKKKEKSVKDFPGITHCFALFRHRETHSSVPVPKLIQSTRTIFLRMEVFLILHFIIDPFLFYPEIVFGKLLRPMTLKDWSVLEGNEVEKNYCELWGISLQVRKLHYWFIINKTWSVSIPWLDLDHST